MPVLTTNDPDYHMGHLFMEYIKKKPKAICQIDAATGAQESRESVLRRSVRLARCFRRLGLQPGDVLALGGRNHLDLHIPYYAALLNGLPISGVDPLFKYDEIKSHFNLSRPKVTFCQKETYEDYKRAANALGLETFVFTFDGDNSMKEIIDKYDDDAPIDDFEPAIFDLDKVYAWLVSSGGTSGVIKLAAFKHKVWLDKVPSFVLPMFRKSGDCVNKEIQTTLNLSPVQWVSGFFNAIGPILNNAIIVQTSAPATAEHVIDIINKYKPTSALMGPSLLTTILRHEKKCDFTCFDALLIAGGKVYKDILIKTRKLTREPKIVFEMYGQSENLGPILAPNPSGPLGSCGRRIPSVLIKLVDPETGKEINEPHTPGELWTKTACFTEYYNNPEETALAFSEDGYYKTGDLLYKDEEDNYFFVERLKMLIKYRSYHVIPPELEEVIRTHPAVQDVSVVGIPNEQDGEWPVACVVIRNGTKVTAKEIEDLVADKLSDTLLITGLGKYGYSKYSLLLSDY
ncbi:hypothetical protein K1T71_011399 [Dendrolimus kikuchii]|uniref:Uncharacterized protein n=1 Tax=Dendrolimus kikuchii TaxID=765133 RepID=A0ACC1CNP2_9NEOP|nr:hypothetical protein K1T71_011399 [Dendrolimus kikuchii]